jgi:hypothetical protein
MQPPLSKGVNVGMLFASWRRKVSLAVHVTHANSVLRSMSAAADGVETASSSVGMPFHATAFFTRPMGRTRLRVSSHGARGTASCLHVLRFHCRVGVPRVL